MYHLLILWRQWARLAAIAIRSNMKIKIPAIPCIHIPWLWFNKNATCARMFSSTGPGSPDLERVGVNLQHPGEEIRSEKENDSVDVVLATLARASSRHKARRIGWSCSTMKATAGQFRRRCIVDVF